MCARTLAVNDFSMDLTPRHFFLILFLKVEIDSYK